MEVYICEKCNYYSERLCNFKKHLKSNKHIINVSQLELDVDPETKKTTIYCCKECNSHYISQKSLKRHMKVTHNQSESIQKLKEENLRLKNELEKEINEKQDCKDLLKDAMAIAKENSSTANTSMNMLKYANLHLCSGEPLEQLNYFNVSKVMKYKNPNNTESKNEEYVKIAIHKFTHNIFHSFIGDMIVEYYKPKTKMDANLIATDTSRLSFIIMQNITKGKIEQKEWINDKSGKKFTELVLNPVIDAVKQTLIEFIEFKKTKELNEANLCLMAKCVELRRDIEVKKFTNQILKYVAPHFHFDNLKLLSDMEKINDMDLTNCFDPKDKKSKGGKSMKIITKKKNKN